MNYDPLDPTFQTRRLEIQKSIMNLQSRLLKRKQLDLQIQKQLLQREDIQRAKKLQGYNAQKKLEQRLSYLRNYDPREDLIRTLQQQKFQSDYLQRLRAIEQEQSLIDRQYLRKKQGALYYHSYRPYDNLIPPLDTSGEVLANKYVNGTRALQLNEELKKSTSNLRKITDKNFTTMNKNNLFYEDRHKLLSHKKQKDHSTVKKYVLSSKKGDSNENEDGNNKYQNLNSAAVDPTPIKMIENSSSGFNSMASNFYNNDDGNKNLTKIQQQESLQQSPTLPSKGLKKSKSKSTQPTNQYITAPYFQSKSFQATQRPKSSQKNSRYRSHHQKSFKSLHFASGTKQSYYQDPQPVEKKILLQVQNRLRMSQQSQQILDIFYAKNITEYLLTIYGKQDKFRKQLKEKICKTPFIERKYDVTPVID